MVQETEDENPDSMDVQKGEPGEPDLDLDLISENLPVPQQLQVQVQVPTTPLVTILPWEDALFNSQTTARLLPHLPPYELRSGRIVSCAAQDHPGSKDAACPSYTVVSTKAVPKRETLPSCGSKDSL
jgi:hypothetical protein